MRRKFQKAAAKSSIQPGRRTFGDSGVPSGYVAKRRNDRRKPLAVDVSIRSRHRMLKSAIQQARGRPATETYSLHYGGCSKRSSNQAAGDGHPGSVPHGYIEDVAEARTPLRIVFSSRSRHKILKSAIRPGRRTFGDSGVPSGYVARRRTTENAVGRRFQHPVRISRSGSPYNYSASPAAI